MAKRFLSAVDSLVAIEFPDYTVNSGGIPLPFLGHAGLLIVHGSDGTTKYYEYGRYDPDALGLVVKRSVPNVVVDAGGVPTKASLGKTLRSISSQAGHGTRILAAMGSKAGAYAAALQYASGLESQNDDPDRTPYSITSNNCMHFVKRGFEAAGFDTPSMIDPRPNSYIDELRSAFTPVDYDYASDVIVWNP